MLRSLFTSFYLCEAINNMLFTKVLNEKKRHNVGEMFAFCSQNCGIIHWNSEEAGSTITM